MSDSKITLVVEPEELDAILAGLRMLQKELTAVNENEQGEDDETKVGWLTLNAAIDDILTNGEPVSKIGPDDIDALCERINSEGGNGRSETQSG